MKLNWQNRIKEYTAFTLLLIPFMSHYNHLFNKNVIQHKTNMFGSSIKCILLLSQALLTK